MGLSVPPNLNVQPYLAIPGFGALRRVTGDSTPPSAPGYRAAIVNYMAQEDRAIKADFPGARPLRRKPLNRSFALFHEGTTPRPVVVMLHGFSAGTEQWAPIAYELFAKGYDVFVPCLPGHGLLNLDGSEFTGAVPTGATWKWWDDFAERIYGLVKSAPNVSMVGLSFGGNLSLKAAERHRAELAADGQPILRNVVAVSPFLAFTGTYDPQSALDKQKGKKPTAVDSFVEARKIPNERVATALEWAEGVAPERVHAYLQSLQVDMRSVSNPPLDYGFKFASQDAVLGMFKAAEETRANAAQLDGLKLQIIASQAGATADPSAMLKFGEDSGAEIYEFAKADGVPHAMVHPLENPTPSWNKVRDLILSRFDSVGPTASP